MGVTILHIFLLKYELGRYLCKFEKGVHTILQDVNIILHLEHIEFWGCFNQTHVLLYRRSKTKIKATYLFIFSNYITVLMDGYKMVLLSIV